MWACFCLTDHELGGFLSGNASSGFVLRVAVVAAHDLANVCDKRLQCFSAESSWHEELEPPINSFQHDSRCSVPDR